LSQLGIHHLEKEVSAVTKLERNMSYFSGQHSSQIPPDSTGVGKCSFPHTQKENGKGFDEHVAFFSATVAKH
jgi:hypothetical protein